jgi:uncharacterized membrane protein
VKLSYLVSGPPGHPLHPPLTDITIGAYTFALVAAIGRVTGIAAGAAAYAWWVGLLVALASTVLTALTGFAEWLDLTWGSEVWKTATAHMTAMLTASVVFLVALLVGRHGYAGGTVCTSGFVLTVVGYVVLAAGAWMGGAITFVHGLRVLGKPDEPWLKAIAPDLRDEVVDGE